MIKSDREDMLKKAERIIKENIYTENKYPWSPYRMISPARGHFLGIWNWDSAFHAVGMIPYDIDIAKEQIFGFLLFQRRNGILPDVIFEDGEIVDKYTKPPVMAHAARCVYMASHDKDFLERIYPALVKNAEFWERERSYMGMFHYDADKSDGCGRDEYLKRVCFETGWDDSPRWDNEEPYGCWPVDLNCYMVMTYDALRYMAEELGSNGSVWRRKSEKLTALIEEKLWDDERAAYADYNFIRERYSSVITPASFMPLYTEIASYEHALAMKNIAKRDFLPGMPTVAYNDPAYDDVYEHAYWRGPCWLNVAYFAAKGLKNYGFYREAEEIRDTILDWVSKDGEYIHENYNATTGKGLCSDHFSWSCVFVRNFLENI